MKNREIGTAGAADFFGRTVHPHRSLLDSQSATRAYAVMGFAGAKDEEIKTAAIKKEGRNSWMTKSYFTLSAAER